MFQLEISGIFSNFLHWLNRLFIFVTLVVFHLEMSGIDNKVLQSLKTPDKLVILSTFQFGFSTLLSIEQPPNI